MLPVETRYEHVVLDEQNIPLIAGTTMKVIELVLTYKSFGWSPEELHFQYPHLTMGQIHSTLAYYWDHQDELDNDIERRIDYIEHLHQSRKPIPLEKRLRSKGLI
jgi:uncharacterized protein (DUF433 family)